MVFKRWKYRNVEEKLDLVFKIIIWYFLLNGINLLLTIIINFYVGKPV